MNTIELKEDILTRLHLAQLEIGNTPIFDFSALLNNKKVRLFAKLEWKQLGGSVKARAAFGIIQSGLQTGVLTSETRLLDASSGNTGIAYAAIGQRIGIETTIVLPENASEARKEILRNLGAELILSSRLEGTDGAQEVAYRLNQTFPGKYFYADQYNNEANWLQHLKTTGPEIWDQTQGEITHFAASLGTTGTFTGVGRYLKTKNPNVCLVQMQPDSPMHGLEGWKHLGTAKVPGIYDRSLADRNSTVSSKEALTMIQTVHEKYNLKISPSAAASLVGAKNIAKSLIKGTVVTVLADDGTKYGEVYQDIGIPLT